MGLSPTPEEMDIPALDLDPDTSPVFLYNPSNRRVLPLFTFFDVEHQSPQVLLIKMGECKYTSTHNDIDFDKIKDQVR